MSFCPACRRLLTTAALFSRHRRVLRWIVVLALLAAVLTAIGQSAPPRAAAGDCRVFYS